MNLWCNVVVTLIGTKLNISCNVMTLFGTKLKFKFRELFPCVDIQLSPEIAVYDQIIMLLCNVISSFRAKLDVQLSRVFERGNLNEKWCIKNFSAQMNSSYSY